MEKYYCGFFRMLIRNENEAFNYVSPTHTNLEMFLYGQTLEQLVCSFYLQLIEDGWQIFKKQSDFANGWYDGLLASNTLHENKRIDICLSRSIMIDVDSVVVEALLVNFKDMSVKICPVIDEKSLTKKQIKKAIKECFKIKLFSDFLNHLEDSRYLIEEENYNENDNGILKHK